jgi:hypothetical protein
MSESKELLEATIKGLQEKVEQVTKDLQMKQKELEDVNKPEMTDEMYDEISGLIEEGINDFDFNDTENYSFEYEIDYDGKVETSRVEFEDISEVTERIMKKIDSHFKIVDSE